MARRIVLLGPVVDGRMKAAEINAMDAGAFVGGVRPTWRVSLTMFDGELADATVITRVRPFSESGTGAEEAAWKMAVGLCFKAREFDLDLPLTVADFHGSRRVKLTL